MKKKHRGGTKYRWFHEPREVTFHLKNDEETKISCTTLGWLAKDNENKPDNIWFNIPVDKNIGYIQMVRQPSESEWFEVHTFPLSLMEYLYDIINGTADKNSKH